MNTVRSMSGKTLNVSPEYLRAAETAPADAEKLCKVCGDPGVRVLSVTVATHVDAQHWGILSEGFRFSATADCPVIYFNNSKDIYFLRKEVKTRYGLKEKEPPRPICYCLQVTEERIAEEILQKQCCYSLQDIVSYTKAGTGKWCLTTNPSGKCCRDYLPQVVDKYLAKVGRKPLREELQEIKERLQAKDPLQEVVLSIKGMTCESCGVSVKSMLEQIGARNVTVSHRE
ncbi:MAG: hypothetical protein HY619_00550, partial [Thaumarchaeota archaeon]|nr:hypothetical protein [Nitrososphaerota archaeon]